MPDATRGRLLAAYRSNALRNGLGTATGPPEPFDGHSTEDVRRMLRGKVRPHQRQEPEKAALSGKQAGCLWPFLAVIAMVLPAKVGVIERMF